MFMLKKRAVEGKGAPHSSVYTRGTNHKRLKVQFRA